MKEEVLGVYMREELPQDIEVGTYLTPGSGMPWTTGSNPRPQGPRLVTPRHRLWKQVENKVWVMCNWGKGCRVVQIGGDEVDVYEL